MQLVRHAQLAASRLARTANLRQPPSCQPASQAPQLHNLMKWHDHLNHLSCHVCRVGQSHACTLVSKEVQHVDYGRVSALEGGGEGLPNVVNSQGPCVRVSRG